jgi:hypothetical protein
MKGLPDGRFVIVRRGRLLGKSSFPEYIEDRGTASFTKAFSCRTLSTSFYINISPVHIQSTYPATSVITPKRWEANRTPNVFQFWAEAVNCSGWFNWEVYEIPDSKKL